MFTLIAFRPTASEATSINTRNGKIIIIIIIEMRNKRGKLC